MSFGRYQFLPWARRGAARYIAEQDTLGKSQGVAEERARIPLTVELTTGSTEAHDLALIGPGDVTNISAKTVIRTEPRDGVGDYEPNLLPYIEFYDEDFAFRYTPASPAASGKHLRPWVALVVLKENEFLDTNRRQPLTSIRVESEALLPPHDELHLWCHVHSNLPHEESNFEAFLDGLEEDVKTDPDGVYSRLLCPRKLEAKTLYHAFLVPAYETGRRAGLGQPITGVRAQTPAWPGQDLELPVYYRWSFRTGRNFDFEYAVKQLKPRIMPERVGVREMDCSRPGFVRADVDEEVRGTRPEILRLGGAVMAPDAKLGNFPPNSMAQPFLDDVEKLVNLNRTQPENATEDPYVSIPFYGMRHAMRRDPVRPGKTVTLRFRSAVRHLVQPPEPRSGLPGAGRFRQAGSTGKPGTLRRHGLEAARCCSGGQSQTAFSPPCRRGARQSICKDDREKAKRVVSADGTFDVQTGAVRQQDGEVGYQRQHCRERNPRHRLCTYYAQ